ncbi:MAG TPA: DUF692 domain-containing protein [Gammaproteobacteria bacterium]|jgi:hypothetical protein|nr:DUF692 domain-containing protein [Gammaproteobacteria bacterium]
MFHKPEKCFGVGINYRSECANEIIEHLSEVDFIEVNTERFFVDENNHQLDQITREIPVVLHGLTLSIGTENQLINENYLQQLERTLTNIDCLWFSEHIAMTQVNDLEIRALMPVAFTEESINNIVKKAKEITKISQKPFILENITYYFPMPHTHMEEARFISEIVNQADCGLLLDLNNLYVNAVNHSYDPYQFIDRLPLDRVVEVHLAGCDYLHGMLVDTHASTVKPEVLALLEYICRKTLINGVIIERDDSLDNYADLLQEVKMVRGLLKKYYSLS